MSAEHIEGKTAQGTNSTMWTLFTDNVTVEGL